MSADQARGAEPAPPATPPRVPVSLAIVNARIRTGDPRRPWADALAVRGDRIAALASSAEVRKLGAARVIDARRGRVEPLPADAADGAVPALARDAAASFLLLEPTGDGAPADDGGAPAPPRLVVVRGQVVHETDAPA